VAPVAVLFVREGEQAVMARGGGGSARKRMEGKGRGGGVEVNRAVPCRPMGQGSDPGTTQGQVGLARARQKPCRAVLGLGQNFMQ
jgi:hypothetical protein